MAWLYVFEGHVEPHLLRLAAFDGGRNDDIVLGLAVAAPEPIARTNHAAGSKGSRRLFLL